MRRLKILDHMSLAAYGGSFDLVLGRRTCDAAVATATLCLSLYEASSRSPYAATFRASPGLNSSANTTRITAAPTAGRIQMLCQSCGGVAPGRVN